MQICKCRYVNVDMYMQICIDIYIYDDDDDENYYSSIYTSIHIFVCVTWVSLKLGSATLQRPLGRGLEPSHFPRDIALGDSHTKNLDASVIFFAEEANFHDGGQRCLKKDWQSWQFMNHLPTAEKGT